MEPWPQDWFEQFWKTYPRRVGKKAAFMALEKVRRNEEVEFSALMTSVKAFARHVYGKDLQYVPHPTTWINQGRWDDELSAPAEQQWSAADRWAQTVARMRAIQ